MKLFRTLSQFGLVAAVFGFAVGCGESNQNQQAKTAQQNTQPSSDTTAQTSPEPVVTSQPQTPAPAASDTTASTTPSTTDTHSTPAQPVMAPLTDAEIAAVTKAVNTGEVQMAQLAQQKASSAEVKQFALHMVQDHTAANKDGQTLAKKLQITPSDNSVSNQLTTEAQQMTGELQTAKGKDFDRAYIDGQVKIHQRVLSLIDEQLLPNAKNTELKAQLQKQRDKVAQHLQHAKDIQQKLSTTSDATMGGKNDPSARTPGTDHTGMTTPTTTTPKTGTTDKSTDKRDPSQK